MAQRLPYYVTVPHARGVCARIAVEYKHIVNRRVCDDVRNCNGTNDNDDNDNDDNDNNDDARIAHKIMTGRFVCAVASGKLWYAFNGTRWISDESAISVRHELSTTVR
jgi:hypothetical protein